MATRRKSPYRRKKTVRRKRSGPRQLPNWSLLVLGLAIGVVGTWLTWLVISGINTPGSGLNSLATSKSKPAPAPKPRAQAKPAPKPTYDFYTILPETETPIAERDWDSHRQAQPTPDIQYVLQAASYSSLTDADRLKAKLLLSGLAPTSIQKVTISGKGTYFRVRVGPFASANEADRARHQLTNLGIKPMMLKLASSKP